mgnify:CR=1 FL=1|tara:strand:- start:204 stop:785 length:582 start_codon:yes stop_codon:yes gene_type:complete
MDNVEVMFSIPLIHYKIENWEHNKKRILDALPPEEKGIDHKTYRADKLTTDWAKWQSDIDRLPSYAPVLIDIIKPYLEKFVGDMPICFTDMWYQKYYNGSYHNVHNHGAIGWSSVVFIEFDPKVHTATRLLSPFGNHIDGTIIEYIPKIEEGDMILFPSSILHESGVQRTDKRRTIISYNIEGLERKSRFELK